MQKIGFLLLAVISFFAYSEGEEPADCRRHTLIINVFDDHGLPVRGWSANDLKATYAGHPLKILGVSHTDRPRRVVILLDVSGSMGGPERPYRSDSNKWKIATAAVRSFVSSAPSGTEISLVTFSNGIENPLISGEQSILQWLDSNSNRLPKEFRGQTALYQAVLEGIKQLEPQQPGDAIYVVTDGSDNASHTGHSAVGHALAEAGVRLFAFLLTESHYATTEDARISEFSDVAFYSGGYQVGYWAIHPFPGLAREQYRYSDAAIAEIGEATRIVNAEISNFYLLTVEMPENVVKPKHWKLEAVDPHGKKRKDWTVTYPHELEPCGAR